MKQTCVAFVAAVLMVVRAFAVNAAPELQARADWLARHFGTNTVALPFSFSYGGRASTELLPGWKMEQGSPKPAGSRQQHTTRLADPATGLVVQCEVTEYTNHPAVEWVIYFENTGTNDTPVLARVLALDLPLDAPASNAVVHYAKGATCSMDDYRPLSELMVQGAHLHLQAGGGRSSSDFLPFFNW